MGELNEFRRALYAKQDRDPTLASETIRLLGQYQFDRSLGVYCLIINGLVWDAEIVLRSVYETSAKTLFLAVSSPEKRNLLADEYWTTLSAIYDRRGSEKATTAERLTRKFDENDARIFRGLQNPDLFEVEPTKNKRQRNEVEQRWSFSEIIKTLSKTSQDHERVEGLDALGHMYGMMSHLSHANSKALELMEDRATRGEDLLPLESTHISRMLSDLICLGGFSLRFAHSVETGRVSKGDLLGKILEKMEKAGENIRSDFDASQDGLYSKIAPQ